MNKRQEAPSYPLLRLLVKKQKAIYEKDGFGGNSSGSGRNTSATGGSWRRLGNRSGGDGRIGGRDGHRGIHRKLAAGLLLFGSGVLLSATGGIRSGSGGGLCDAASRICSRAGLLRARAGDRHRIRVWSSIWLSRTLLSWSLVGSFEEPRDSEPAGLGALAGFSFFTINDRRQ